MRPKTYRHLALIFASLLASLLGACGSAPKQTSPDLNTARAPDNKPSDTHTVVSTLDTVGGDRPVTLFVPSTYAPGTPTPLLLVLHGYSASGDLQELYFRMGTAAEAHGILYAHPDGTLDSTGRRFWNATDACCDFGQTGIDDSAYLRGVIDEIAEKYTVDRQRIFLVGHSNGGFMAYRMACEHADLVAAIVSLAGAMPNDVSKCQPSEPVNVVQIHGTADATINYEGGVVNNVAYPSAQTSVEDWAKFNGCSLQATEGPTLDLDRNLDTAETSVSRYETGCNAGQTAELWTIHGGTHIPSLTQEFSGSVVGYLMTHPKQPGP